MLLAMWGSHKDYRSVLHYSFSLRQLQFIKLSTLCGSPMGGGGGTTIKLDLKIKA